MTGQKKTALSEQTSGACCGDLTSAECTPTHEQNDLTFFSRIASGATIDINEVFAGLDQTVGLLSDYLKLSDPSKPVKADKILRFVETVQAQIETGAKLAQLLNQFAYQADEQVKEYDLNLTLHHFVEMVTRFAAIQGAAVKLHVPAKSIILKGDPFVFQHALFLAYQALLTAVDIDDRILIDATDKGQWILVTVEGPAIPKKKNDCIAGECDLNYIKCVMAKTSGNAQILANDDCTVFKFELLKG